MRPMRPCLDCGMFSFGPRCVRCASDRRHRLYGSNHLAARQQWAPLVGAGLITCWRCNKLIHPGTSWDLGHRPGLLSKPEHAHCNRVAGGASTG